jgi:protease I
MERDRSSRRRGTSTRRAARGKQGVRKQRRPIAPANGAITFGRMKKTLQDVRVAVLAADGFEQVEVTWPVRALRSAGADVRIISLRPGNIQGVNFIWRGKKVPVDDTVFSADPRDYAALFLPGGFVNPDLLRQSETARQFVAAFDLSGKPIAVICHGAETLISAELIEGRTVATWPGIADDVRNAGGIWEDRKVVRDRNWVSSRGPQDLPAFTDGMISLFDEQAERGLPAPPRRVRWMATAARVAKLAAIGGAVYGAGRLVAARRAAA